MNSTKPGWQVPEQTVIGGCSSSNGSGMRRRWVGGQVVIGTGVPAVIQQDPIEIELILLSQSGGGKLLGCYWIMLSNHTSCASVLTTEKTEVWDRLGYTAFVYPCILACRASAGWCNEPHSCLPRGGSVLMPSTTFCLVMRKEEFKGTEWSYCVLYPYSQS